MDMTLGFIRILPGNLNKIEMGVGVVQWFYGTAYRMGKHPDPVRKRQTRHCICSMGTHRSRAINLIGSTRGIPISRPFIILETE